MEELVKDVIEDLESVNEEILESYKKLFKYKLTNNKKNYNIEKKNLSTLLLNEKAIYDKIDNELVIPILEDIDDGSLRNINSIFDKFYTLAYLDFNIEEELDFRILNNLRDKYIMIEKLSKFNDEDNCMLELDDQYDNKMLNTLVVEHQLFKDLLSLFITNLDNYINTNDDVDLKKDLLTYKYIALFTYAKNDIHLIEDNNNNNYIYSKLLCDMLSQSEYGIAYNYDIIKSDYLDKALYIYLKEILTLEAEHVPETFKLIQKSYCEAILMLYGQDYQRALTIFNNIIKDSTKVKYIEEIFNDYKKISSKAKVLTLTN